MTASVPWHLSSASGQDTGPESAPEQRASRP
jgi:hypothetical protein